MKSIPYGRQTITDRDIEAVVKALRSDFLTQGPEIEAFEKAFAAYIGVAHAVAVANGTAALHLAAMAAGVGPGKRVITTPITFAASANCVRYCGGEVDFCDVDPHTHLLDLRALKAKLESQPKGTWAGVIPVDFAGLPVNLGELRQLADQFGLFVIEDACHAPGATYEWHGRKFRSGDCRHADMAIFSFHPVKHIACGEGGMITTNDAEVARKLRLLRTHGIRRDPAEMEENHGPWFYEMAELGFNYRITDMQAALGRSQLAAADTGLARRNEIAKKYQKAFAGTKIKMQSVPPGLEHAWHLFVVRVPERKRVFENIREKGIYAQVHYIPVHLMPYYKRFGWKAGAMPVAERYYQECISLPMYPALTDSEQDYVIASVLEAVK